MIEMSCPRCGKELQFADSLLGQGIACPNCNQKIRIYPRTEPRPEEEPAYIETEAQHEDRREDREPFGVDPKKLKTQRFRKKRRKPADGPLAEYWNYFMGGLGWFVFVLAGLAACWVLGMCVGVLFPPIGQLLGLVGTIIYIIGWWWIVLVAFRDDAMYGVLCFVTILFAYVYVVMNFEGTWRPAGLMILGFLMMLSLPGVLLIRMALGW
jgi:DNA-directed RNA polymerase subunit RPC12/RpoP